MMFLGFRVYLDDVSLVVGLAGMVADSTHTVTLEEVGRVISLGLGDGGGRGGSSKREGGWELQAGCTVPEIDGTMAAQAAGWEQPAGCVIQHGP